MCLLLVFATVMKPLSYLGVFKKQGGSNINSMCQEQRLADQTNVGVVSKKSTCHEETECAKGELGKTIC